MRKMLILVTLFGLAACSGGQAKKDPPPTDVGDPPADDRVAMPKGAAVVSPADDVVAAPAAEDGETSGEAVVERGELKSFLDKGPSYVLTIVTVEPVHGAESFQGYQIVQVTRGAREFMMPQLQVGDVVTHVNGIRLMKPEDYMEAWRGLGKVGTIRVDFLRQGGPMHAEWVVR